MRITLKITISILIATIIFALFTIFAYSGLFLYIESKFYNPRLREEYKKQLSVLSELLDKYHQLNIERYSSLLKKDYIYRSFLTRQLQEDILNREEDFRKLKIEYHFFVLCRLVGEDGKRIHYSTLESDIKEKDPQSIIYFNLNQIEKDFNKDFLTEKNGNPKVFIQTEKKQFIYSFPVVDNYGMYKGSALFYISSNDLNNYLLNIPSLTFNNVNLINNLGLLFNFPEENTHLIERSIKDAWQSNEEKINIAELSETINGESYLLFSLYNRKAGFISLLVPSKKFLMSYYSQIIILVSFFLTVFLTVFLLLNLRQDVHTILNHRIKRFQIEFIKEFIESKDTINWEKWHQDLKMHSSAIKSKIKSGLGKIKKDQEKDIDNLINKSWEEIIGVFISHTHELPKETNSSLITNNSNLEYKSVDPINLKHIEDMLQQLIQRNNKLIHIDEGSNQLIQSTQKIDTPPIEEEEIEEIEEFESFEETEPNIKDNINAEVHAISKEKTEDILEIEELEVIEDFEEAEEIDNLEVLPDGLGQEIDQNNSLVPLKNRDTQVVYPKKEQTDKSEDGIEELEVVPGIEALPPEPFERLEYLPLVDDIGTEVYIHLDEQEQNKSKKKDNLSISAFTINIVRERIEEITTSIIDENGIFKIRDELYEQKNSEDNKENKLYESFLTHAEEMISKKNKKLSLPLPFVENKGFKLDDFFNFELIEARDISQQKSMITLSKRVNAVAMALLHKNKAGAGQGEEEFVSYLTLGFDEETVLRFKRSESFFQMYLNEKQFVVINTLLTQIEALSAKFSENELKMIKKLVFLPAFLNSEPLFILFGFCTDENIAIEKLVMDLKVILS